MKAVERHLYIRNGYYYYRCGIKRSIRSIVDMNEIVLGLGTQDLSAARVQSVQLHYEIDKQLQVLQQSLEDLSPEESPDGIIHNFTSAIKKVKASYGYEPPIKYDHLYKRLRRGQVLFSQVVEQYLKDCPTDTHGTRFHKQNTYILFTQLMGDLVFRDIGTHEAKHFKSLLMKIPSNAKKLYKIESFEDIDLDTLKGKPQHPKTINNRLAYIIALFNWAIRAEYYHGSNPFSNLIIRGKKVTANRRHPFTPEELSALFESGLGKGIGKFPSMYWVPLIGLYSGMRLNEICQLYVKDVRQEDGVYIFDVNDDGEDKGLKTESSRRKIPIHTEIIRCGLLDYVADMREQKNKRLFPDIPMGKSAKTYSSTFTKRFWRLLKELKIKRDGLCFHSLRHTFIDGMRNAGVERSIVMTLTGHQSAKGVHDAYGYGYNLSILQEGINKLSFPVVED